jgi:hypothetical protein
VREAVHLTSCADARTVAGGMEKDTEQEQWTSDRAGDDCKLIQPMARLMHCDSHDDTPKSCMLQLSGGYMPSSPGPEDLETPLAELMLENWACSAPMRCCRVWRYPSPKA